VVAALDSRSLAFTNGYGSNPPRRRLSLEFLFRRLASPAVGILFCKAADAKTSLPKLFLSSFLFPLAPSFFSSPLEGFPPFFDRLRAQAGSCGPSLLHRGGAFKLFSGINLLLLKLHLPISYERIEMPGWPLRLKSPFSPPIIVESLFC